MADEAELLATIARLEAALGALASKVEAYNPEEQAAMLETAAMRLEDAQAEAAASAVALQAAEARVAGLEDALSAAVAEAEATPATGIGTEESERLRVALDALSASSDDLRSQADGAADASLKAELDALRAARALDLAEMRAILTELEPMLEVANA